MNSPRPAGDPASAKIPASYAPPPDLLEGRVALVTGAGQGLGRAVALQAARCGATVALLGRKLEKLEATYDAILAEKGPEPALVPLDLAASGSQEFDGLYQVLAGNLGRLDAVVHCASHFVPLGPLENQTVEQWMALLKVNLAAPFALTRACLPLLRASADPAVVFTGETHGVHPLAYWGGFAVSKAALSTLVAIWSQELEHAGKPRMSVFVPGPIASPQRAASHPGESREKLRRPEDAARALLYLLGPEGRNFDGQTVEL